MSDIDIQRLRLLAVLATEPRDGYGCKCDDDTNQWFDRSICPEPCGMMHTIHNYCGRHIGYCAVEAAPPSVVTLEPDVVLALLDRVRVAEGAVARVREFQFGWEVAAEQNLVAAGGTAREAVATLAAGLLTALDGDQ